MSQHTPDSWIERHWLDEPVDPFYNACEEGECTHYHCDGCARIMPEPTDSGHCVLCDLEYSAQHQLTFPDNGRLSGGVVSRHAGRLANSLNGANSGSSEPKETETRISGSSAPPAQTFQPSTDLVGVTAVLKHFMSHFGNV